MQLGGRALLLHGALFAVSVLAVFDLVDWRIALAVVLFSLLLFDRKALLRVDISLLATFLCFFVFVANLRSLPQVSAALSALTAKQPFFCALGLSQIISNVPAALMLSSFTQDARAMILGTDIGGLGTLVASLASLITYKLYVRAEDAQPGRFLWVFTLQNLGLLIPLGVLGWLLAAG